MPRMNGKEPTYSDWKSLKTSTLATIISLNRGRIMIWAPDGVKKRSLEPAEGVDINGKMVQITARTGREKGELTDWEWDPEW